MEDWPEQYYAENLERLIRVRSAVDPGDLFRGPQSIPTLRALPRPTPGSGRTGG